MPNNFAAMSPSPGDAGKVAAATHRMRRLRLVINDQSLIDGEKLQAIAGVMGVAH
ncbi:hypothetical protein [Acerihabitans sp.]|uniref:hypothetical protein n=1 Tax=Acerihabitans sp. TaxID=2811394 RepID=UPI002ED7C65F